MFRDLLQHVSEVVKLPCIQLFKGAQCSFGEVIKTPNLYIYSINKMIIHTLNIYVEVKKQAVLRRK